MDHPASFADGHVEDVREAAWAAYAAHLERTAARLDAEVREYPTPIARCDQQLAKLLEQRSAVRERRSALRRLAGEGALPPEAIARLLAEGPATDEAAEAKLRERLRASLHARPCLD